jgi:uncharacterized protein (DUF1015 family)
MVHIFRFAALRPDPCLVPMIAAVPYDVVSAEEAREEIAKNPLSFLRVSRSDAGLPDLPPDDPRVYAQARENFSHMIGTGRLCRDPAPGMYVYRIEQGCDHFTGLCCCLDVRDYQENRIRRHELTRYDKEADRTNHIDAVNAHNGPVVLLYRDAEGISAYIESLIHDNDAPDAEVRTAQGALHRIYRIRSGATLARLETLFSQVPTLYIADGHHRAKSAANVAERRKREGRFTEEAGRFMGVLFAESLVRVHGYSRLVTDLGPYTPATFLEALGREFAVSSCRRVDTQGYHIPPRREHPENLHVIHMYLDRQWYECSVAKDPAADAIRSLDVEVLQEKVLEGLLGITDPRGDPRLQYLGGARPLSDLAERVDSGGFAVAFSMQPVRVETVLSIADSGGIMPPKSTWFEPKLLSGLIIHPID